MTQEKTLVKISGMMSLLICVALPIFASRTVSLQSFNYPDHYIRHKNFLGEISRINNSLDRNDATFKIVAGLADPNKVSFESVNYPGYFLRHQGWRVKLHKNDGTPLFLADATFRPVAGLANTSWTSFESHNYPGKFLRHRNYHLWVEGGEGDLFGKDVTFLIVSPLASSPGSSLPIGNAAKLQSINFQDHYIRHRDFLGEITTVQSKLDHDDATFKIVPGLSDPSKISFESVNYPGFFLRHQGWRIKLHKNDGSQLFRDDATFKPVSGLADASWTSFESHNYPGKFIRHRNYHLWVEGGSTDLFRKDATFRFK